MPSPLPEKPKPSPPGVLTGCYACTLLYTSFVCCPISLPPFFWLPFSWPPFSWPPFSWPPFSWPPFSWSRASTSDFFPLFLGTKSLPRSIAIHIFDCVVSVKMEDGREVGINKL
ncbi:hypothetical protein K432DRAFT_188952 [Lepidopterella palustris CBS 459.81]|uniref:Uncharacterized protein n=1 Tax=Lepidopterella palustris CBS 459.81 TaxID=1314670 RepID=A0A8E2JA08_9PEZI|nr:hypothetical protein K432DRAFT_188952 [Lepidopterella palustris CBS 459.81]